MFSPQQGRQRGQRIPNCQHPFQRTHPTPYRADESVDKGNPLGISCSIQGCRLDWQQFLNRNVSGPSSAVALPHQTRRHPLPSLISSALPLKNCAVCITDTLWWSDSAQTRVFRDNKSPPLPVLMLKQITASLGELSIYFSRQVWELAVLSQARRTGKCKTKQSKNTVQT